MSTKNTEDKKPSTVFGVSDETYANMTQGKPESEEQKAADAKVNQAASNYENITNETIISPDVKNAINRQFVKPSAVTEADTYLASEIQKIQSGRTSYTDQIKDMMSQIQNRDKFSYDVDTDPLFQQALASAMNSGKTAMQDTIGQASALTGGYGSTYATSAGNQAYNSFIEDAYDNLPQYYQMAMEAYQMEGDEMYRQLGMLNDADATEYSRMLSAFDATSSYRDRIYNEAYGAYRDEKSDAFAMANLEISEHNTRSNDAYNLYTIASNYADTMYERDYNTWRDKVNQYMQIGQMESNDAWNKSNQEFQATESQKEREWKSEESQKDREFTATQNSLDRAARGGSGGKEIDTEAIIQAGTTKEVAQFKSSLMTENEFKRRGGKATFNGKSVKFDTYQQYVEAKIDDAYNNGKGSISENQAAYLYTIEW